MRQLPGRPLFQVELPLRIVGVGRTPDLHPPQDPHPGRLHQPDRPRRAGAVTDRPREDPVPALGAREVAPPDPLPAPPGMAPSAPSPQLPEDPIVHRMEDALARGITV